MLKDWGSNLAAEFPVRNFIDPLPTPRGWDSEFRAKTNTTVASSENELTSSTRTLGHVENASSIQTRNLTIFFTN